MSFQDLTRSDSFGLLPFDGSLKSVEFCIFIIPLVLIIFLNILANSGFSISAGRSITR